MTRYINPIEKHLIKCDVTKTKTKTCIFYNIWLATILLHIKQCFQIFFSHILARMTYHNNGTIDVPEIC